MKVFLNLTIITAVLFSFGCPEKAADNSGQQNTQVADSSSGPEGEGAEAVTAPTPEIAAIVPKTIREHFMALPEKYFYAESCDKAKDKDCKQAKRDYLKTFLEVEDIKNGYLKAGCDGGQSCIEMTIFRKPDNTYLVAVVTEFEEGREQHFLEYEGSNWSDAGRRVIPEYGSDKIYELPRQGTTMSVFEKKVTEKGEDFEIAERGKRLYDLVWKDGKFSKK
ncbi:MAG: hypothetical protein KF685_10345 [Acidobacteria bacterium]|nr:hypothetical protein [Acidobacteriota bacterium]